MYIGDLEDIGKDDAALVGDKAAALGELKKAGVNVPTGFVVTFAAHEAYQAGELSDGALRELLRLAVRQLGTMQVVVSAAAINHSFGATLADPEALLDVIKKYWQEERGNVAVLVQRMVKADVSGVMTTVDPVMNDSTKYVIEAVHGLGELLAQGVVIPDKFVIDKQTSEAQHVDPHMQQTMLVHEEGQQKEVELPKERTGPTLGVKQLHELQQAGEQIEKYFNSPQEIEWAIDNDVLYVLQARPVVAVS